MNFYRMTFLILKKNVFQYDKLKPLEHCINKLFLTLFNWLLINWKFESIGQNVCIYSEKRLNKQFNY